MHYLFVFLMLVAVTAVVQGHRASTTLWYLGPTTCHTCPWSLASRPGTAQSDSTVEAGTDGFSNIKCWECQSISDPKCADPFDNSTIPITDCSYARGPSHSPSICRKIRQKVNGEWHYIRGCASLDEAPNRGQKPTCFNRTTTDNIIQEHCTCGDKDGCNSSFTFKPSALLLSLVVLFPSLVKML